MNNYLIHMRTVVRSIKTQTYLTIIAVDDIDARNKAQRLAAMLPGDVTVLSVQEV